MISISTERLRPSDRLVLAFAGVRQKLGGSKSEFHRSLERLDCAALFIRDPERRWYQYDESAILDLVEAVQRAAREVGASRLVCIGNSMGGFGALYFGARLGADAILAFAAQTAIDPQVTEAMGDRRWAEHQAQIPAYPFGDLVREAPARGRTILCWGDDDPLDRAHAERLAAAWAVESLVVPDARHDAAARLRDRGELAPLLGEVIAG